MSIANLINESNRVGTNYFRFSVLTVFEGQYIRFNIFPTLLKLQL